MVRFRGITRFLRSQNHIAKEEPFFATSSFGDSKASSLVLFSKLSSVRFSHVLWPKVGTCFPFLVINIYHSQIEILREAEFKLISLHCMVSDHEIIFSMFLLLYLIIKIFELNQNLWSRNDLKYRNILIFYQSKVLMVTKNSYNNWVMVSVM